MANSRRNSENTEYNVPGPAEHSNQEATNYNPNAGNQEQLLTEFQDNLAKINGQAALEWENRKDVGIEPLEANTEYTKDEIRALRDLNFTDAEKTQFQEDWAREKLSSQFQLIENLAAEGWEHRFVTDKELEALRADPNIEVILISDLQTAAAGSTNDADLVHRSETDRNSWMTPSSGGATPTTTPCTRSAPPKTNSTPRTTATHRPRCRATWTRS